MVDDLDRLGKYFPTEPVVKSNGPVNLEDTETYKFLTGGAKKHTGALREDIVHLSDGSPYRKDIARMKLQEGRVTSATTALNKENKEVETYRNAGLKD